MDDTSYAPLIQDMVWSYSRICAFEDCPYRWYLKYIRYPKIGGKELFFSSYGKFMHDLLAKFYSEQVGRDGLEAEYLTQFTKNVKGFVPNGSVLKNYFSDGLRCIRRLEKPNREIVAVERYVDFSVGKIPMIGFIDCLEKDASGEVLIIDHKSRKLKPRSNKKKPTKSDEELDRYLRQLYLYSIPIQKETGRAPQKLCFHCFRTGTFIEEPFSEENFEKAKQWVTDSVKIIMEESEFRPDIEFFKCNYLCEMQDHCVYFELSK